MFYPVDSLKRGGRFYLCWVADSWPLRFATITHRQLWSQDIRTICDELIEVVANESGRPTNRYSLRLSSQLMRGLVRLYQRKVTVFLNDLCMINANVIKHANKKFNVHEVLELPHRERPRHQIIELLATVQETEDEQRVEEIIENSGNVVANIQDITLKESAIPEFHLPPNDGFGEENPDQALLSIADRTVEQMMMPAESSLAQHSGLGLVGDVTDKSHDKSRLLCVGDLQMERLSEHDVTLFRRSDGEGLLSVADFEKDNPEISDVPIPELPVPQEKIIKLRQPAEVSEVPIEQSIAAPLVRAQESEQSDLEELEEYEPIVKRRKIRGLIIDKKIKINANVLRARIENPHVDLRCENSSNDIIVIQVPYDVFLRRPCHAGFRERTNFGQVITRLFMKNLGVVNKSTRTDREEETAMVPSRGIYAGPASGRITELEEPIQDPRPAIEAPLINQDNLVPPEMNLSKDLLNVPEQHTAQDIGDMLTQKLDTLDVLQPSPKKRRTFDYVSFTENRQRRLEEENAVPTIVVTETVRDRELPLVADKENVPANKQTPVRCTTKEPRTNDPESVTAMLQEAGLADIPPQLESERPHIASKVSRKNGSDSSETMLGSLDRTKVSLGDSDQTTDSKRIVRDQWGTEGTMIKILHMIKEGKQPITVKELVARGPVVSGSERIIAARCFMSILKLKQHGFIKVKKFPHNSEIENITLGDKFN